MKLRSMQQAHGSRLFPAIDGLDQRGDVEYRYGLRKWDVALQEARCTRLKVKAACGDVREHCRW